MNPWLPINARPRAEPTKPSEAELRRGRMRRRVEDIDEARALGPELVETCLGCGGRALGGAELCFRCRDRGQMILL